MGRCTTSACSVASLAVVGPNLFVAVGAAPLLFNRWARSMTSTGRQRLVRQTIVVALTLQVLVLPVLPFSVDVLTAVFGDDYREGAVAVTPLLLALFPLVVTRVVAPALQAGGDTSVVSVAWAIRLAAPWVLLPAADWVDNVVLWATLATACGEYAAMGAMLLLARRRSRLAPSRPARSACGSRAPRRTPRARAPRHDGPSRAPLTICGHPADRFPPARSRSW